MNSRTDELRRDKQALLDELNSARPGCVKNAKRICCPFHDDRNPGNSVYESSDGVWRVKCWNAACSFHGDIFDVRAQRTGMSVDDVLKEESGDDWNSERKNTYKPRTVPKTSKEEKKPRWFASEQEIEAAHAGMKLEGKFPYTNPDTDAVECLVYRFRRDDGKKHIPPYTPVDGGWLEKGLEGIRPIFNRKRVRSADHVIIVEGENKVHALTRYGFVGTCNMGGSNSTEYADWSPLAGKKRITIWRDNDEPGMKWQEMVIAALKNLPKPPEEIRIVWVDGLDLPEKGDVADLVRDLEQKKTAKEAIKLTIESIMRDARSELTGSQCLIRYIDNVLAGLHRSIPWSHTFLTSATYALTPGTVTIIYGSPGSSKSLFLLQECIEWSILGVKWSILQLEQTKEYHLRRFMAVWKRDSNLTKHEYVEQHAVELKESVQRDGFAYDTFFNCMFESPLGPKTTTKYALDWIESRFVAGDRIVAVDPISVCTSAKKPWIADLELINAAKTLADKHHGNIILISHTDKSGTMLMGGAALTRFTHCVLKLTAYPPDTFKHVGSPNGGASTQLVNRSIYIEKSRDSYGAMQDVGFLFNVNELFFYEKGQIKKRKREEKGDDLV